ncbi:MULTISPECIES: recombinase family protein [Bacteroidaceae]|jgi:site-specific DNA recombinase|uniref:Recombinase family protein n=2 Tax=Phocaeicola TaxID=909656 RepID=A0A412VHC6_PHOVU|nr:MULTISPECIES: recombinase family protein [Bacteroidaceae]MBF7061535.1 recombinase family protein [Bacteroides sp. HF-5613]RGV05549.1 recombinase family protein [Phocaeicola vulgatus]RGV70813.1 recombinase family protein [Phocaeicola dorei]
MKRVIGYIRVSTDNQDLERQRVLIRKYCENKGYSLLRIEEDYAISGTVSNRNGLNSILNITNSVADMVVVSELSRLSRQDDIFETLTQIHTIIRNVDLVILDEPDKVYEAGKTIILSDFLMLAIKAYGAADERKKIVSRMTTGKDSKVQAFPLMLTDSNIPTGFKAVPNPNYIKGATPKMLLVEDEERMQLVRDIFNYVANGLSLGKTAEKLNMLGYRTARNKPFYEQSVRTIINDSIYNGVRYWKGIKLELPVKFISDEIWNLAHKKVQENKNYSGEAQKHYNPLKGIIKCPCGQTSMYGRTSSCITYRCLDRIKMGIKSPCTNVGIKAETLIYAVWKDVRLRTLDETYQAKSNEKIAEIEAENIKLTQSIKEKDSEIAKLQSDLKTVIDNVMASTNITIVKALNGKADSIDSQIKSIEAEKTAIDEEIASNNRRIADEIKSQSRKELDSLSLEGKGEMFRELLSKVVYYSVSLNSGFIVITYKNDLETIIAYHNRNKPFLWALPITFRFNKVKRTVIVPTLPEQPKMTSFVLERIKEKEYTFKQLQESFNLEEYKI